MGFVSPCGFDLPGIDGFLVFLNMIEKWSGQDDYKKRLL